MYKVGDNYIIIEHPSELPDLRNARYLYMDFETTSFDPARAANQAHKGDRIAGIAVTVDDDPNCYYVPIRHYHHEDGSMNAANLPIEVVQEWLNDCTSTCEEWVNANVKFDAHFARFDKSTFTGRLVCLTTAAKVLDSDMTYKGGYGLKNLSARWLDDDEAKSERDVIREWLDTVKLPRGKKAKDYGIVPIDKMGKYACNDARAARELHRYITARMPEDCVPVWETEILLTPVLYDMEVEGMRVDQAELEEAEMRILMELIAIEEQLHRALGFAVCPSKSTDCYQLLCVFWGLPVLSYNDDGNPSFDKDALLHYSLHPEIKSDPGKTAVVELVRYYRKRHTLLTFFVRPYQEHQVDGVMHPAYNQAVRSGRLSCKRPNAQQLNKEAKSFVKPGDGRAFLSCDYSQVEFRLIVHYTRAIEAIEAYERDPFTDFHTWVAEMCGIPRKPAKNVNFAIGFGAGKKKVTTMLAGNMELMNPEHIAGLTQSQLSAYCQKRAEDVFNKYNAALPGLKPTTKSAAKNALDRGFVFNAYGRRLHLPSTHVHIAFNRVVQSCAADIMKSRTVALAPRYNDKVRELGLKLAASVHDETLFVGDKKVTRDPRVIDMIVDSLEDVHPTMHELRVPIKSEAGWSDDTWATASGDDGKLSREHHWERFVEDVKREKVSQSVPA